MDLDSVQTRRLYLAGTVSFPMPFPSTGTISIERGKLTPGDARDANFVVVQERAELQQATTRVILIDHVAAIFFPDVLEGGADQQAAVRNAAEGRVDDLESGKWFLHPIPDAEVISRELGRDVSRRSSGVKGIVFVPEHRPVLSITEVTRTAGATGYAPMWSGCSSCN